MKRVDIRPEPGQQPSPLPFSEDEFYEAIRLIAPEGEARELASALAQKPAPGTSIGFGISVDTLALLAMVSQELEARVRDFIAPAGESAWPMVAEARERIRANLGHDQNDGGETGG